MNRNEASGKRVASVAAPGDAGCSSGLDPGQRSWLQLIVLAGAFAVLNLPTLRLILLTARTDPNWSHAFLVPLISAYMLSQKRDAWRKCAKRLCLPGLGVFLLGFLLSAAGRFLHSSMVVGYAMVVELLGLVLFLAGPGATRIVLVPILYLAFAVKITLFWDPFALTMQRLATTSAATLIALLGSLRGIQAEALGSILRIYRDGALLDPPLNVDEACSGLRMLMALLAFSVAYAYTLQRPFRTRAAIVLAAIPAALAVNIARIALTGLLFPSWPHVATGLAHESVGILMLFPALGCLWALRVACDWLGNTAPRTKQFPEQVPKPGNTANGRFPPRRGTAIALTVLLAAIAAERPLARATGRMLERDPTPLRQPLTALPPRLGPFRQVQETRYAGRTLEVLGSRAYVSRVYADTRTDSRPRLPAVWMHAVYYSGTEETLFIRHTPDQCYIGRGHQRLDLQPTRIDPGAAPNSNTGIPAMRLRFIPPEEQEPANVFYFFICNGRRIGTKRGLRLAIASARAATLYYCKVEVLPGWIQPDPGGARRFVPGREDLNESLDAAGEFLEHALPEIERCLPAAD